MRDLTFELIWIVCILIITGILILSVLVLTNNPLGIKLMNGLIGG